jgi:hypothetical protein
MHKSKAPQNIIEFIRDPKLIGGDLSPYQETALRLLYGLPLDDIQKGIACAALDVTELPPAREYSEGTFICGRRSGKSDRLAANVAVYEAATGGHEKYLAPGERGRILVVAQDKRAAQVVHKFILAKLEKSKLLSQLIEAVRSEEIDLKNRLTISIFPCSFRAPRGFAIPVALLDEVGFFRVEGVNVDKDVIDAIRPGQATFPRAKLILTSTPYMKVGALHHDFATRHQRSELLCFQAPSRLMNPAIPRAFLDSERERDPAMFDREYGAIFTDDLTNFLEREAVEACIVPGRFELPFSADFRYTAGVDPSGGGADEFTLSVCHVEQDKRIVQDVLRAYRSRQPQQVVKEMADLLKTYHVTSVTGDRYSGEWVRSAFREQAIEYRVSDLTASEAFLELLPLVNQGSVALLDDRWQTAQLLALERRKSRGGRDAVSHPANGHDDRANALALAAVQAQGGGMRNWGLFVYYRALNQERREQAARPETVRTEVLEQPEQARPLPIGAEMIRSLWRGK